MQSGLSAVDTRANIIRAVGELSIEKVNDNEYTEEAAIDTAESDSCMTTSVETEDSRTKKVHKVKGASHSSKQKDTFSRTLLPSEVCIIPALYTRIRGSSIPVYVNKNTYLPELSISLYFRFTA